jgi:hypothetical protein
VTEVDQRRAGIHALYAYAVTAALVAGLVRIDVIVPGIGHLGSALVAVTLLYAPVAVAHLRREDLYDYGFRVEPVGRGVIMGSAYALIIFPIFALGYFAFYEIVCSPSWKELRELAPPGACKAYQGIAGLHAPRVDMGSTWSSSSSSRCRSWWWRCPRSCSSAAACSSSSSGGSRPGGAGWAAASASPWSSAPRRSR